MIEINDLMRTAKLKGITNRGYAEKDYLQDILLLSLSKNTKNELVFKGGTCLYKFYNIDRFSDDLDFSCMKDFNVGRLIKKVIADMNLFGMKSEVAGKRETTDSILLSLKISGLLYRGTARSISRIQIDINLKSEVFFPELRRFSSLYPDIPGFSTLVMKEKEILAEKIRAIMTRTRARDVYDLCFLLKKGTETDPVLIREKLKYYNIEWNLDEFIKYLDACEGIWRTELETLVKDPGSFSDTKENITRLLNVKYVE
ncbi:MAG: hypothetical protein A7315_08940 [Candidatus Altiarchaeales archaeon WOR_SM1_79]|nr:MAG: hypothetical protein A7315_08940 [Candidatus Altiarchaeales archaeon WOR_SM1_79]